MVPMSLLNQLAPRAGCPAGRWPRPPAGPRRSPPCPSCRSCSGRSSPNAIARDGRRTTQPVSVELSVLCRRTDQIEAAMGLGVTTIYADYQDIKQYRRGRRGGPSRRLGGRSILATPRIEKPGEANIFGYLAKQGADGILVRNAGGMRFCSERGIPFVADFSLNAANPLTVELFKGRGAVRVTASYDLNVDQLLRSARRDAAIVARGRDSPADPDVSHGALCLLRVSFAGDGRDQLRSSLRPSRRQAPRPRRHGSPPQGRRWLPEHTLQRRSADGRRIPAAVAQARRRSCGSSFSMMRRPRSSERSRCIARSLPGQREASHCGAS